MLYCHWHFMNITIAYADRLIESRRMLERSPADKIGKGLGPTPPRSMAKVTPTELL